MMDVDMKKKWVDALRSGEYKKGEYALRTSEEEFCCLGVLCDLVRPDDWVKGMELFTISGKTRLPPWDIESVYGSEHTTDLYNLNDQSDTFEPVVKWIEENL